MEERRELERVAARKLDGISPARQAFDRWFLRLLSRGLGFLLRRWLALVNLINGLILAGAVLVPLMRHVGLEEMASAVFTAYHVICQQIPDHSYFLLGHQLALDQRMMAIYGFSLVAGLVYVSLRGRLHPLSWRAYFILVLPMAADGFTQLFGWRHSTWQLRTATGALFGIATVWLAYPHLDAALRPKGSPGRSPAPRSPD